VTGVAPPPDLGADLPGGTDPTPGRIRPGPRSPSPRDPWRRWLPATVIVIVVLAGGLVWWGSEAILSSTGGNLLRTIDDPAQPGFEALVEPTPVMAVIALDADGALDAVSLLSLAGPSEGAVIVAGPTTLAPDEGDGRRTLADAWALDGGAGVRRDLGAILNVAIGEDRVVDAGQWSELVEPVAPLSIANTDDVTASTPGGSSVRFPAGNIEVAAGDVAAYLEASSPGESDLARLVRVERFWAAWIAAVGDQISAPGVVPGEAETGLGRFVRALAGLQVELAALPVVPEVGPGGEEDLRPSTTEIATLVARLVPFPLGASPDSRLRVRILDGTGQLDNGLPAARSLVTADAEVATVGNATRFDYAVTQFIVPPGIDITRVERLRAELGVGEVIASAETASAVDVTVVLGTDAIGPLGGPFAPPTTAAGGGSGG
jgi:hypothetical protein